MDKKQALNTTKHFIENLMNKQDSSHDYLHILRVYNMALWLAQDENVDLFIIKMSCLLHELEDNKMSFYGEYKVENYLHELGMGEEDIIKITDITFKVSFSAYKKGYKIFSKEGMIVQDADRLDALGAIGIARAFNYGGKKGSLLYSNDNDIKETTLNHFYDKLFILETLMNTEKAKKLAKERTEFMKKFVDVLKNELRTE